MAKRTPCAGHQCSNTATLFVRAFGTNGWSGFYCDVHAGRTVKLRGKLIRKYNNNVVVRPITDRDRKLRKKASK